MTTDTQVRPLPLNTVMPVKGTSFRQDVVRTVVEHDEVRIRHDTVNAHDPNACTVETLTGQQLGFVPAELARRLALPHPGGRWRARIVEVYRNQTWGLRVQLGPLVVEGARERAGADAPGLRHRGDGVAEAGGVVVTAGVDAADGVPVCEPVTDSRENVVRVYAKSGRLLGTLVEQTDRQVVVTSPAGRRTVYPSGVVRIDDPVTAA